VQGFQIHVIFFDGHQLSRGCIISPPKLENNERFGEHMGPLENTTGQLDTIRICADMATFFDSWREIVRKAKNWLTHAKQYLRGGRGAPSQDALPQSIGITPSSTTS
jgi:hypothetical protein